MKWIKTQDGSLINLSNVYVGYEVKTQIEVTENGSC